MTDARAAKVLACLGVAEQAGLLGSSSSGEVQAEVAQWVSFAFTFDKAACGTLEDALLTRSYLVGNSVSLADFSTYVAVADSGCDIAAYPEVSRWYRHIQSIGKSEEGVAMVFSARSTFISLPESVGATTATHAPLDAPSTDATSADAPTVAAEAPAAKAKGDKPKGDKGDKGKAAPSSSSVAPTPAVLDPSKLDIRCGLVLKCWDHPESEKLLCEEVDMGGGEVRNIASGLRAFYTAEQLQGRKVLVLANLKERPMAGFKSQGMVLCAVNFDHTVIKLVEPPAGAEVGERVSFPGFVDEPATPAQMAKKKILEGLAPGLRTDAKGVAMWENSPFTTEAGVCTAPGLGDATVS